MEENTYRITQIETQKKNDARVSIFLDGRFAFGLNREVLVKHPLYEGEKLTDSQIDDVLLKEERVKAKEKTLKFLSYRAHSIFEIKKKLSDREISDRTIDHVIKDFTRVGLLNDAQFAEGYTRSRLISRPMGRRLIEQELKKKGIHELLIQSTLDDAFTEKSELDMAILLAEKRMDRYQGQAVIKGKKKVADFLGRRGFAWDVIYEVINSLPWPDEFHDEN